jgi:acetyl esterase/lipase
MNARGTAGRLLVGLTIVVLLGGCASGASPTPTPAAPTPTSVPSVAAATPMPSPAATATATPAAPTPTPAPTPSVVVTRDVAFESSNPVLTPGVLDVYAPAKAGPWPVVVMFHGGGGLEKQSLASRAQRVADLGFVVFVPTWGAGGGERDYGVLLAYGSQGACAAAFARANAAEYGGDPATLIVFGHSAGANIGASVAFARSEPTAGCLGGTTPGAIDALITWEGDWVLETTFNGWDQLLAADPAVFDAATPWKYLPEHKDLKVVMLVSEFPRSEYNLDRPLPDPEATDAFFAPRDPAGVLRQQLEANGALTDGILDVREAQELLFSVLEAQGNPVSLDVMPGSTHTSLSEAGWKVFLAAFGKAVAQD